MRDKLNSKETVKAVREVLAISSLSYGEKSGSMPVVGTIINL
jgi:hypothetical protein